MDYGASFHYFSNSGFSGRVEDPPKGGWFRGLTRRECDVILSDVTCLSVRRARRLLRVRPGLRPRRRLRDAPGIQMQGTSSKPCEPSADRRNPPTYAHPTHPHALRTTRSCNWLAP